MSRSTELLLATLHRYCSQPIFHLKRFKLWFTVYRYSVFRQNNYARENLGHIEIFLQDTLKVLRDLDTRLRS